MECMFSVLVFDVQTIPKLSKGQRFCNKEIRTNATVVSRIQNDSFFVKRYCEKIPGSSDVKVVLTWFILIALDYENITDPSSLLHE